MPQSGKHRLTWRIVDGPIVEDKRTNCRGLPDRPGNAGSPASTGGHGPLLHLHDHLRRPLCGNPYCRSDRRARTPEIQPVAAEPAERLAGYEMAGSRRIITHRPAAADFLRRSSAILVASSLVRAMPRNIWIMPSEGFSTSAPHPCGCTRAGAASRTSAAPVRRSRRTDFRRPRSCVRSCMAGRPSPRPARRLCARRPAPTSCVAVCRNSQAGAPAPGPTRRLPNRTCRALFHPPLPSTGDSTRTPPDPCRNPNCRKLNK